MKLIKTMVMATGLAAALTVGAQAQTITGVNSTGTTLFDVLISPSVTAAPSPYTYTYLLTLTSDPGKVAVNSFNFNFLPTAGTTYVSSPGYTEASVIPGSFAFGGAGLVNVGDKATFTFQSPLPPTGSVAAGATSPGTAGGGTSAIGPGPAVVPEASTYALLGLGLLPLAFLARRRMANSN